MNALEREQARDYERFIRQALKDHPKHCKYVGSLLVNTQAAADILGETQSSKSFRELMAMCPRMKNGKRKMVAIPDLAKAIIMRQQPHV